MFSTFEQMSAAGAKSLKDFTAMLEILKGNDDEECNEISIDAEESEEEGAFYRIDSSD